MPLAPGARVGSYEVIAAIGRGGTGEVYRARDLRLQREVAIIALPEEFQRDSERLARFEREARVEEPGRQLTIVTNWAATLGR